MTYNLLIDDFLSLLDWVLDAITSFITTGPIVWLIGLIFVALIIKLFVSLLKVKM